MRAEPRYSEPFLREDLKTKMLFLGGPRQVGKTTLALRLLGNASKNHPAYLNWDFPASRKKILAADLPAAERIIVLDEIHKFKRWRNLVKGMYDQLGEQHSIVVTGSARLDYYRRGGDSLQGRYHYHRLHPFSLNEFSRDASRKDLDLLLKFGGFPEPLFSGSETKWRRWQLERTSRVINEDVRDLENIREISLMGLLADMLPSRVGAPLSLQALRNDLEVSHDSVRRWVDVFENLYFCFRVPPYGVSGVKAVKKEQKLYLWDWSMIEQPGFRFENMVASQLLKYCHFLQDTDGFRMELRYLRNVDEKEIDFVVLKEKKPLFAVECKTGERNISGAISYFAPRTPIPVFYQVHLGEKHRTAKIGGKKIEIVPFQRWAKAMKFP
ncbi:MAG: ATP-binding protein [Deltaproteobacteria bacterium]|nr:ATP-binding protein [Deltaproteobacteria bacterium]